MRSCLNVIGRVADKWTMCVLEVLDQNGTLRFTRIAQLVGGISQRMLTKTLRQMEQDGFVMRKVYPEVPPKVEYKLTPLGRSLCEALCSLWGWAEKHSAEIEHSAASARGRIAMEHPQRTISLPEILLLLPVSGVAAPLRKRFYCASDHKREGVMKASILFAALLAAAIVHAAALPAAKDDGNHGPKRSSKSSRWRRASRKRFIRKLAQWDQVSAAGGQPPTPDVHSRRRRRLGRAAVQAFPENADHGGAAGDDGCKGRRAPPENRPGVLPRNARERGISHGDQNARPAYSRSVARAARRMAGRTSRSREGPMTPVSRRDVLKGLATARCARAVFRLLRRRPSASGGWDFIVVGAGVFGAWTAWNLQRKGHKVLLLDAWGAAHSRASSGGETRLIRTEYAGDPLYTRWAWESLG